MLNKARAPNYELAENDYNSGMKYKEIAEKYNVTLNTVKSWKTRYKWSKDKKKSVHTKDKKVCTQKVGAPKGNKNAAGNKGGAAPVENKNAEKHGFFSKWLPEETLQIIGVIKSADPLDLLWDNIQLQYAAIIRAQKLMHVKDQGDTTKVLKRQKESSGAQSDSWEKEYELQFAWDKHATFLNAQSRAMKTLEGMIKQYDELLHKNWDLATEEQRTRIEVLKARAQLNDDGANTEDDGFIEALMGKVDEVWSKE